MIWFKHCYWPEPDKWGVLGLPKTQDDSNVLNRYSRGDLVLLALTKDATVGKPGTIGWICTLHFKSGPTKNLVSPDVELEPHLRWRNSIVIDELWKIPSLDYFGIANGKLAKRAEEQRGKLFPISDGFGEMENWLSNVNRKRMKVQRSLMAQDYIDFYGDFCGPKRAA